MFQKSFNIEDAELTRAKKMAKASGVSLNKYLRLAVIEKNNGTATANSSEEHLQVITKALQDLTNEMALVRIAGDHAQEASRQREQELIRKVGESLEEHRQQVGGMLRQFLHIVASGSEEAQEQEAPPPPTPTPRKHVKKPSWQELPS